MVGANHLLHMQWQQPNKGDKFFFLITGYAISFVGFLKMVLENLLKLG